MNVTSKEFSIIAVVLRDDKGCKYEVFYRLWFDGTAVNT
jgi:hypothetical protein